MVLYAGVIQNQNSCRGIRFNFKMMTLLMCLLIVLPGTVISTVIKTIVVGSSNYTKLILNVVFASRHQTEPMYQFIRPCLRYD